MATARVDYYSGDTLLRAVWPERLPRFRAIGGQPSRHNAYDSFSRMVGLPADGPAATLPVTRKVFYKKHPSRHQCGARCRSAKGHDCECSCGGKYHGADA